MTTGSREDCVIGKTFGTDFRTEDKPLVQSRAAVHILIKRSVAVVLRSFGAMQHTVERNLRKLNTVLIKVFYDDEAAAVRPTMYLAGFENVNFSLQCSCSFSCVFLLKLMSSAMSQNSQCVLLKMINNLTLT